MAAAHPFNTEKPLSVAEKLTFDTISNQLKQLVPRIEIEKFVGLELTPLKNNFSSLAAHKSTLDGIYFRTSRAKELKEAFYNAKDRSGKRAFASMKEDPDHWALKKSFGVTPGIGWREIWRPQQNKYTKLANSGIPLKSDLKMRFGTAGVPFNFSALHCSIDEQTGLCNIHIDEAGFVLDLPGGFALTPDAYQHIMDELLLKTMLRDWLVGGVSDKKLAYALGEVLRRVSLKFPNSFNGFAGLKKTINSFGRPTSPSNAVKGLLLGTANIIKPIGLSVEAYRDKNMLIQVNYMKVNNQASFTLTLGGKF